jgi:hypothetical protein
LLVLLTFPVPLPEFSMLAVKHLGEPPTLPATLSTPDGSYVLKFDNPQNGGRWKPNYFTKLLIPADLRNKMFVSRQPG